MIVVDASVLATALVDDGPDGRGVRGRLHSADLTAPAHLDVEFLHAPRGLVRSTRTSPQRSDRAIAHLVAYATADMPPSVGGGCALV